MGLYTLIPGELTELSLRRDEEGHPISASCTIRLTGLCHELEYCDLSLQCDHEGYYTTASGPLDTDIWLECWMPGKSVQEEGGMEMPALCAARGAQNVSLSLHVIANNGIMQQISASGPYSHSQAPAD